MFLLHRTPKVIRNRPNTQILSKTMHKYADSPECFYLFVLEIGLILCSTANAVSVPVLSLLVFNMVGHSSVMILDIHSNKQKNRRIYTQRQRTEGTCQRDGGRRL